MKTVDIFRSMGEQMFDDPRVQRYGMILAREGLGGLRKADPVTVWIDVGIAFCDACDSYLKYAAKVEISQQLEIENNTLRAQIDAQLKRLGIELAKQRATQENRRQALKQRIEQNRHERARILKVIHKHSNDVFRIHRLVCEIRMRGYSEELEQLQTTLDSLIGISFECLVEHVN